MRISDWSSDVCSSDLAVEIKLHVLILDIHVPHVAGQFEASHGYDRHLSFEPEDGGVGRVRDNGHRALSHRCNRDIALQVADVAQIGGAVEPHLASEELGLEDRRSGWRGKRVSEME